jgi:sulfur relay (sulfurtransferase) DsrC/TusE family protein
MIESSYEEVHWKEWQQLHLLNKTHDLIFFRNLIPWQLIINLLSPFYATSGKKGKDLRMVVAIFLLQKLKGLSDREVIKSIQENRYHQYFCNIADSELFQFISNSALSKLRERFGIQGINLIEYAIFEALRQRGFIQCDQALIDSTVEDSNIVFPTDCHLMFKAFLKMESFAKQHQISQWWDHDAVKKLWRTLNLDKSPNHWLYLFQFYHFFKEAITEFKNQVLVLKLSQKKGKRAKHLIELLDLLFGQTQQKLAGERHIDHRIISLDEVDARPIKKGKRSTEFGSSVQMSFNRDGFMVTTDVCIGQADDKGAYLSVLGLYIQRMRDTPEAVVTDLMYRTKKTLKILQKKSSTLSWGVLMMCLRKFRNNVIQPEPLLKASSLLLKTLEALEKASTEELREIKFGQNFAKPLIILKNVFNSITKNGFPMKLITN